MGLDYSSYGPSNLGSSFNSGIAAGMFAGVWTIVALILSLVGCFLIYFMFVNKKTKLKNAKLEWLRSFLRFDKMLIEVILKISYIFSALFITLFSFTFFAAGAIGLLLCPLCIIFGNLATRLVYEGILVIIMIWKNTTEIKDKVK